MTRLSQHIFLKPINGELVLWDYKNHRQYALTRDYADRIFELAQCPGHQGLQSHPIDDDLASKGLIDGSGVGENASFESDQWGWDSLAHIFHFGTSNLKQPNFKSRKDLNSGYSQLCSELSKRNAPPERRVQGESIDLPSPDKNLLDKPLIDALMERKTTREFLGTQVTLAQLSTLLFYSFGYVHGEEEGFGRRFTRRKTSPSGGNIHPDDVFLWIQEVEGIRPGLYYYDPQRHELVALEKRISEEHVRDMLLGQYFADGSAFGIFLVGRFDKGWAKYNHSRGYRAILLDLGHVSQTFQLACTSAGLNTWLTGAFKDKDVNAMLGLNENIESTFLFLCAGTSTGSSFPNGDGE